MTNEIVDAAEYDEREIKCSWLQRPKTLHLFSMTPYICKVDLLLLRCNKRADRILGGKMVGRVGAHTSST